MDNNEILTQLTDIIRRVFRIDSMEITLETKNEDIDGWTSLGHALLIDTIEKKFDINFELDDILVMHSIKDIYLKIVEKNK